MNLRLVVLFALVLPVVAGCAGGGRYIPVFAPGERGVAKGIYVVRPGDTLYSIAFRFDLDYKALARANNISPPYTIFVDQELRLNTRSMAREASDGPPPERVAERSPEPSPRVESPRRPIEAPAVDDGGIRWAWPNDGEVVERFSLSGNINKGIDIRGDGDAVRSSADGVVVYAGGGLRGYGKLVIVKHNDRYLSAYGHNRSLLVKEGDPVKSGQVVARLGGPNGDSDVMYFEIRRDGKPRDPLLYLPARG